MAVPLFTVSLNTYTFFFNKFNYGVNVENCNHIVRRIDYTFNVAVQYLQCKHLATFARSTLYTKTLIFHMNSNEKSACVVCIIHECVLYARFYGKDITVTSLLGNLHTPVLRAVIRPLVAPARPPLLWLLIPHLPTSLAFVDPLHASILFPPRRLLRCWNLTSALHLNIMTTWFNYYY